MVWSHKRREENNICWRVMELEVEGRSPVGMPKKDMRKLNITEDMAEDRK